MADWTVSNAGTTACNGDYTENGTAGGKACYELAGGGYWIYWSPMFGQWWIGDTGDKTGGMLGLYATADGNLPGAVWFVGLGDGAAPAPTVTSYSPPATGQPMQMRRRYIAEQRSW